MIASIIINSIKEFNEKIESSEAELEKFKTEVAQAKVESEEAMKMFSEDKIKIQQYKEIIAAQKYELTNLQKSEDNCQNQYLSLDMLS